MARRSVPVMFNPPRWAEITLECHYEVIGICGHCFDKYGVRRPWPCSYAQKALDIKGGES